MDANVALAELRSLVAGCLRVGYRPDRPDGWAEDVLEALERVDALDEHLSRGGYFPAGWAR